MAALTDGALLWQALALGVGMIALALLARAWWRLHRRAVGPAGWRALRRLASAERGTATMEFALVFPVLLALVLILLQTTLVMAGRFFVHYSAFAATRSAITYIPSDAGAMRNRLVAQRGTAKFDAIRHSAVLAVMPVSGELSESSGLNTDALVEGLGEHFQSYGQDVPHWVENKAAARLRYADENTEVTVMYTSVGNDDVSFEPIRGAYTFGPKDPITVRVQHKLNLSVPYARALFSDGQHTTADGEGAFANVPAQVTLTNEGLDPSLPPEPVLPREDRRQ